MEAEAADSFYSTPLENCDSRPSLKSYDVSKEDIPVGYEGGSFLKIGDSYLTSHIQLRASLRGAERSGSPPPTSIANFDGNCLTNKLINHVEIAAF